MRISYAMAKKMIRTEKENDKNLTNEKMIFNNNKIFIE